MKYIATLLLAGTAAFAQQSQDVALNNTDETYVSPPEVVQQLSRNKKRHEAVVKPVSHQNNSTLFMSNIGMRYAFLALPERENTQLTAISLPLMKAAFEAEGRPGAFEKVNFYTLMKVELLHNVDGKPGDKIEGFEQTAVVTNTLNDKRFDIALTQETSLPAEGVFVQLTVLGRCDAEGNLSHDRDFTMFKEKAEDTAERKWMEYCQPNFPLVKSPKGTLTFYKNPNNKDDAWRTIDEPALHQIKKYPDFNIGFGYTLATYK